MIKILTGGEERSDGYCEGEGKRRGRSQSSSYLIINPEISPKFSPKLFLWIVWHFSGAENSDLFSGSENDPGSKKFENHCAEFSTLDD